MKSFKMIVYPIVSLILYVFLTNFLEKPGRLKLLHNSIFTLKCILLVILFFEVAVYKTNDVFMSSIHADNEKYWRIRLLTMESSWTGSVVIIINALSLFLVNYLKSSKGFKIVCYSISSVFLMYYTIHSESKGFLLLLLFAFIPTIISFYKKFKIIRKYIPLLIIPLLFFSFSIYEYLYFEIQSKLYVHGTFGTRLTGYLSSLELFLFNPFGVGLGPYLYAYPNHIENLINYDFMGVFNLDEVSGYINSAQFLSTKTFFFDNLIFGGLGFILFFMLFFVRRFSYINSIPFYPILKNSFIFILLSGVTYITYGVKYDVWVFFAVLDVVERKNTI